MLNIFLCACWPSVCLLRKNVHSAPRRCDTHTHTMEYFSAIKKTKTKTWNLAICDNMDRPGRYYAKWNKSDIERQISYDFTHTWNIKNKQKNQINLKKQTKQKQTHRYREQSSHY